jgi:hypothetical protein
VVVIDDGNKCLVWTLVLLAGLHKMPWVFTYNNYSEKYDHMLKVITHAFRHFSQGGQWLTLPKCLTQTSRN